MRILRVFLLSVLIMSLTMSLAGCTLPPPPPVPGAEAPAPAPASPAAPAGQPDISVTVSEGYLADLVNAELQKVVGQTISQQTGVQVEFSDPNLDLQPDNIIRLDSVLSLQLFGVDVTLEMGVAAQVTVADDHLAVDILSVTVEGFPLPQELIGPQLDAYEQVIQEQLLGVLQQVETTIGLRIVGVETTEDALTIQLER